MADEDEFLTYDEAAQLVKVSRSTIMRWARNGWLRTHRAGRVVRVLKTDVLAVLKPSWGGARDGAGRPPQNPPS